MLRENEELLSMFDLIRGIGTLEKLKNLICL